MVKYTKAFTASKKNFTAVNIWRPFNFYKQVSFEHRDRKAVLYTSWGNLVQFIINIQFTIKWTYLFWNSCSSPLIFSISISDHKISK